MLALKINTIDRSEYVKWNTLQTTSVLTKEVDRMEFEIVKTPSKTSVPDVGDDVALEEDGTNVFGGVIVEKNEVIKGGLLVGYQIRCKDYSQYLDREVVTKSYASASARSIVLDIIATFTSGFTTANVAANTPTVGSIKFNYEQPTRCLTQLADQIGWDWYVDYNKDIHFFETEAAPAPFNLTDAGDKFEWKTLEINKSILQVKNVVYVRGGEYKKTVLEADAYDIYVAAAGQLTFPLAFKYDNITVKKGGVVQTIGTDQNTDPASVDCLYNFNEKFVKFTSALAGGETVKVYGDAYIPIIAQARDSVSIAAYGTYEAALVDKSIESISEAQARARAELKKYSESVYEAQFRTKQTGLRVGQSITLTSAIRSITKAFKINRIVGKAYGSGQMEYTAYMIASGQADFTDIMLNLLGQDKKNITIATNEVLERLEILTESVAVADAVTPTARSGPYVWGLAATALPDTHYLMLLETGDFLLLETGDKLVVSELQNATIDADNLKLGFATLS